MRRWLLVLVLLGCSLTAVAQLDTTGRYAGLDSLLTQFYDRFEKNVSMMEDPKDRDYLIASVTVNVSPTFFAWISQFEGCFTIAGPKSIREKYQEHLKKALDA